jgi:hypothetical protein
MSDSLQHAISCESHIVQGDLDPGEPEDGEEIDIGAQFYLWPKSDRCHMVEIGRYAQVTYSIGC